MVKGLLLAGVFAIMVWVPWMDGPATTEVATKLVEERHALIAACSQSASTTGYALSWYPFGRLVHTCAGDHVISFWGTVRPLASAQQAVALSEEQPEALTCAQILNVLTLRMSPESNQVEPAYEDDVAEVDYDSWQGAVQHKKEMEEARERGPVFAGRYAVAGWTCGARCQKHAIIDTVTGRIIASDIEAEYGLEYTLTSNILVTNPAKLVVLPEDEDVALSAMFSLARTPREYYRIGIDEISGLPALTKVCIENAATGVATLVN